MLPHFLLWGSQCLWAPDLMNVPLRPLARDQLPWWDTCMWLLC